MATTHTIYLFNSYVSIEFQCIGLNESGVINCDTFFVCEATGVLHYTMKFIKPLKSPVVTAVPAAGYHLTAFVVDGVDIFPLATITFTDIVANHTVAATFVAD